MLRSWGPQGPTTLEVISYFSDMWFVYHYFECAVKVASKLHVRITGQKSCLNYMGACFQAPHATPRQRPMEMHYVH